MSTAKSLRLPAIDMGDHQGLRGIMSIWIVVFHALMYTAHPIDIQGSSLMPMFFLLSGFSLTIGYYKKLLGKHPVSLPAGLNDDGIISSPANSNAVPTVIVPVTSTATTNNDALVVPGIELGRIGHDYEQIPRDEEQYSPTVTTSKTETNSLSIATPTMTYGQFIVNRLIRVLPAYYICSFMAIPSVFYGYSEINPNDVGYVILSFITTFIPTSTWFLFFLGSPLDGPGWTVQTLIGLWLMFPLILRILHARTDLELLVCIRWMFWLQCGVLMILTAIFVPILGFWPGFCLGTMHPLSRIWCFIMGVAAGIICLRYQNKEVMPWFNDSCWFFPFRSWNCKCCLPFEQALRGVMVNHSNKDFEQTLYIQTFSVLFATFVYFAGDTYVRYTTHNTANISGAIWLQALVPYSQLNILVAMTRHSHRVANAIGSTTIVASVVVASTTDQSGTLPEGTNAPPSMNVQPSNLISKFLRYPIIAWLGDLSMSIYLVHYPLAYFISWANRGKTTLTWPDTLDCTTVSDDDNDHAYKQCVAEVDNFMEERAWPQWLFVVLPFISILFAWIIFKCIETPCNKLKF